MHALRWTRDDWAAPVADQNIIQSVLKAVALVRGPDEKYPDLWEKPGEKSSLTFFVLDDNL